MKRWEVYWADFPYEDIPGQGKRRPVVITQDKEVYVLTLKVTSQQARANDPYDYPLRYWQEANLPSASVVRVSKLAKLRPEAIKDYIGQLQPFDILRIQTLMRQYLANRDA